ncbi:MAG: PH domain-containing protein [Candidatus Bruticola sp.]
MKFLNGMLGNASEVSAEEIFREYAEIFIPGETIDRAYRQIRDLIIFTNKRFIFINIQGLSGKKVSFYSIPYKNISHFCTETAGTIDLDSELKIWVVGSNIPVVDLKFSKDLNINDIQVLLAGYTLKS